MSRLKRIHDALFNELKPVSLTVDDESSNHHVPVGAQTHFKVTLVSARFEGLTRIARHRFVNSLLTQEFSNGLHALSLHLYTPEEADKKGVNPPASPSCRDGFNKGETK